MESASQMSVFVRSVEEGSFSAAARSLQMSPSAVSKQIQRLEERLGRGSAPAYGLSLALNVKQERMAIDATNITTRFNVIGKATYAMRSLDDGAVLLSGSVDSFTGYSATGTTAATQAAQRDARERLMTILADQIVTRLMAQAGTLPE